MKITNLSENEKRVAYHTVYDYSGLSTTNLWRDSLITNQGVVLLNYSPLLDFDGITRVILLYGETLAAPLKDPDNTDYKLRGMMTPFNCVGSIQHRGI